MALSFLNCCLEKSTEEELFLTAPVLYYPEKATRRKTLIVQPNLKHSFMELGQTYTAKNATDMMQVVDFTDLMQFAHKLYQAC